MSAQVFMVLIVLMPQDYRDEEFTVPYQMLKEKGIAVSVAGLRPGAAVGAGGSRFTPELQLNDLHPEDFDKFDAMVIPGGPGSPKYLWKNEALFETVRYFFTHNKVVAAICYAGAVPALAGILKYKKATVFPTDQTKAIFAENQVTFLDQGVVVLEKDHIITAQGPAFVREFGSAIINMLQATKK